MAELGPLGDEYPNMQHRNLIQDGEIVCRVEIDAEDRRTVKIQEAPLYAQITYELLAELDKQGMDVILPQVVYTVIALLPRTVRVMLKEDKRAYPR